jgi:hypothetical protein
VTALLAKRTFLEKVTILHAEYYRDPRKPVPQRYSRHYYDVALMASGGIKQDALANESFWPRWYFTKRRFIQQHGRATTWPSGAVFVLPPEHRIQVLRQDYREMAVMIFGNAPSFEHIMKQLSSLEKEINRH